MSSRCVLMQMVIFVGIGSGIGFAHSRYAPVDLSPRKVAPVEGIIHKRGGTEGAVPAAPLPPVDPEKPGVHTPVVPPKDDPAAPKPAPKIDPTPAPVPPVSDEETLTQAQIDKGHITIKQAHALYTAVPPAYFVDTRRKDEYEAGHVKDAFGIPLAAFHGKTPSLVKDIDRSEVFVVYCIGGDCDESEQVAKQLDTMGYKHVYVMHAGFPGWEKAGLPVGKGPGIQEAE
ncbi:MAG: hypothetical protein H7210_12135 [Pyrinomonadaceae bacterium]|nr:hypothetical protein [Phycisphaerales bacterium]